MSEGFFNFVSQLEPSQMFTNGPQKVVTLDLTMLRNQIQKTYQAEAQLRVQEAVMVFIDECTSLLGHQEFFVLVEEVEWYTLGIIRCRFKLQAKVVTKKKDKTPLVFYRAAYESTFEVPFP